jgi:hypothetical protein
MQRARASFVVILPHQKIEMSQNEEVEKVQITESKQENEEKNSHPQKQKPLNPRLTPLSQDLICVPKSKHDQKGTRRHLM